MTPSSPSDPRTPEQRLQDEAARWRKTLREEQAQHAATWTVLRATNRLLLRVVLRDRLADPRDFDVFVGADVVTDATGRLIWDRVDRLSAELVEARPHLAAPRRVDPPEASTSALGWLATELHGSGRGGLGPPRADQRSAGEDQSITEPLP